MNPRISGYGCVRRDDERCRDLGSTDHGRSTDGYASTRNIDIASGAVKLVPVSVTETLFPRVR